jgi:hypothetical protein
MVDNASNVWRDGRTYSHPDLILTYAELRSPV